MKKLRIAISSLLCASLFFTTACGASDDTATNVSTEKGRFVQSMITPENAKNSSNSNLLKDPSGKFIFFSGDYTKKYESSDNGDTWAESDGPGAKNPDIQNSIYGITSDAEGNLYGIIYEFSEDTSQSSSSFVKLLEDGTFEKISFPEMKTYQDDPTLTSDIMIATILPNGKALIYFTAYTSFNTVNEDSSATSITIAETSFSENDVEQQDIKIIGVFDISTGQKEIDLSSFAPNWDPSSYASNKDTLILFDSEGNGTKINLSDGSVAGTISIPMSDNGYLQGSYNLTDDGTLYSLDSTALYKITDSATEKIADSAPFAFGAPSAFTNNLYLLDDQNFIASVQSMGNTDIYKYTYDPNATKDPNKVLTVWSLNDDSSIRSLISEFSQTNPDATITYTPAIADIYSTYSSSEQENTTTQDDAIKALNTELLSGKGPDIIFLDGLSAASYAEKGTLLDLTDKVDTSKIFKEILDASKSDGKLYSLPTHFSIPLLVGEKDSFSSVSTQTDLAKAIAAGKDIVVNNNNDTSDPFASIPENERPVIKFESFDELFSTMWNTSANAIIADNKLQEEELRTFLTNIKTISDKYKLAQPLVSGDSSYSGGDVAMISSTGAVYYGSSMGYMDQRALYGALDYNYISSLEMFKMDATSEDVSFIGFPGLSDGVWNPTGLLAVNANSKKSDFAVEFVNTAFSLEAQSVFNNGLPVTQEAVDAQIKQIDEMYKKYPNETSPSSFTFDFSTITSKIKTPYFYDAQTYSKVNTAAYSFCEGSTDLDATINKIKEDFRSYLAERE